MGFFNWLRGVTDAEKPKRTVRAFGDGFSFGVGGGPGYNAAGSGRRRGKNGSILGPNLLTLAAWQQLIRSSRDAIRNSAVASSAIQRWESNMVGTGIQPHFTCQDPEVRAAIQTAWDRWIKCADHSDQLSFYGLQAQVARQLFEAGEIFCRYHVLDEDNYFQLQLIETEQVPIYYNAPGGIHGKDDLRMGIIFDPKTDKRIGYRMYQRQPYDNIGFSGNSTGFINVDADEMIHVMKPSRPGDLRGLPLMASVLTLLEDIEGYADSERLRKRLSAMFAFFITTPSSEDQLLPTSPTEFANDPSTAISDLEPGTAQVLQPGETINAPEVPQTGDYASFMAAELHKFAAAVGITYEMLTGDYNRVNYSSARVALLEFRRSAEQFQQHILIHQFCDKVLKRWMKEAVLSGNLELPDDYVSNPGLYEACNWIPDGWTWVDPLKEVQAAQGAVRAGFMSKSMVIRQNGFDPAMVDAEIALERAREKQLGIVTDTNSNEVLIGKETQPTVIETPDPDQESDLEADEDQQDG